MFILLSYRDKHRLDKDRIQLLDKNKKELCQNINLKTGEILDVLINRGVITVKDKQLIMVRIVSWFKPILAFRNIFFIHSYVNS